MAQLRHVKSMAKVQGKDVSSPGSRHVAVGQPCKLANGIGI